MKNKIILLLVGTIIIIVGLIVFLNIPSPSSMGVQEDSEQESLVDIKTLDFDFPETLDTAYISTVDWPPVVRVEEGVYSCTEAGEETARAGETREQVVNGHTYCVTVVGEGAAGSVYRMYTYNFNYQDKNVFVNFSLRFPQCANYPDEERLSCEAEQNAFKPGELIDEVMEGSLGESY